MIDALLKLGRGCVLYLEREAGYITVGAALIVLGVCIIDSTKRMEVAHDIIVFGLGIMSKSMGGKSTPAQLKE